MESYVAEWLNLLVRWLHLMAGIAWIGSSFYFIWLDGHLEPYRGPNPRIAGELWSVHGGGFYHNQKYRVGPERLPAHLHWFKWEAYTTWMSGVGLLAIVYWHGASVYLIDKRVADLSVPLAILLSIGVLILGWLVYDSLCKLLRHDLVLGALVFLFGVAAAWGLSRLFGARAAYLHVGAMFGTIMSWNVFFVIIPGQKQMVEAIRVGRPPDPEGGRRGKQRSVHNNYLTLPVLFTMMSIHFPMTYGHPHAWLVLSVIGLAGVLIRHFFNLRHRGRDLWALPAAAAVLLGGLAVAIAPTGADSRAAGRGPSFAQVRPVIQQRCSTCHSAAPTDKVFTAAPNGVVFDSPEQIKAMAARINERAVLTRTMPLANLTGMTDDERGLLGGWIASGAKTE